MVGSGTLLTGSLSADVVNFYAETLMHDLGPLRFQITLA
jgi:hypothetical protein